MVSSSWLRIGRVSFLVMSERYVYKHEAQVATNTMLVIRELLTSCDGLCNDSILRHSRKVRRGMHDAHLDRQQISPYLLHAITLCGHSHPL
jgi:hypothetical protein